MLFCVGGGREDGWGGRRGGAGQRSISSGLWTRLAAPVAAYGIGIEAQAARRQENQNGQLTAESAKEAPAGSWFASPQCVVQSECDVTCSGRAARAYLEKWALVKSWPQKTNLNR